jgi:peptidoglycan L-alanyl-D-glutamate endopeptidase CwlK
MDRLTIEKIRLLHPTVREEVLKGYTYVNNMLLGKGIRLRFSNTFRSFEEQKQLYANGRSKPGKIITNAREGLSMHNYGLAFDIVLLIDKDNDGSFETASWDTKADFDKDRIADWMEIVNHFKKLGWAWGGDWKSFPDYPHLEKMFDLTPKQLLSRYNSGMTFSEIINGKTYTWINL